MSAEPSVTSGRFDPASALRPAIRELPGYQGVEDLASVAEAYGVDPADVIKLDGNENPYGPAPGALAALRDDYPVHRYPDAEQRTLRAALSSHVGVDAASIVVGAGSDELIDLLFRLFVGPGDRILTASPTFGMYAFDAAVHDAVVVDVPRTDDWDLDEDAFVEAAAAAKAVFIPSPNNPTGGLVSESLVDRLLATGVLLVIDEAYIEFASAQSFAVRAAREPGLIVLRTFSKWGGLAGLRIGYGIMNPDVAELLMRAKQPYNVGIAAEIAALATLRDAATLDAWRDEIVRERDRVTGALRAGGLLTPFPSEANFLLCRVEDGDGLGLRDALRRRGVFVRHFDTPRLSSFIRMSIGTPEQNDHVIRCLADLATGRGGAPA